jgi:hypothetical protein
MLLFGAAVFVALLYLIGKDAGGDEPDGRPGGHALGRGLDGYAAFSRFLDKRGMKVKRIYVQGQLNQPGLLILTPPHFTDPKVLAQLVEDRRYAGPTIVILPKWLAMPARLFDRKAKPGWVLLASTELPDWPGFADDVTISLNQMAGGEWHGAGSQGKLPNTAAVLSGSGDHLIPLVAGTSDERILAAYINDGGNYPSLADLADGSYPGTGENADRHPLILVFEPDLFNNYGMANATNAQLADQIVRAAVGDSENQSVSFDLTLNGFANPTNLLTLAFEPPFLAATLALMIAALAVGWRAFNRFGPPRLAGQAIAFGKRALVGNAAGLVQRARRLHLLGAPYADAARDRLVKALALPPRNNAAASEEAIDRALAVRDPSRSPFSEVAARLRGARRLSDILRAAQELHAIERTLKR